MLHNQQSHARGAARRGDGERPSSVGTTYPAGFHAVEMGAATRPAIVRAGWGAEEYAFPDGRVQIVRFLLPGDITGIPGLDGRATTGVRAVTRLRMTEVVADGTAATDAREAAQSEIRVALDARNRQMLDQIIGLGRMNARERTAEFLLGLFERLRAAGMTSGRKMPLPVTQQEISDHLGISVVHVNRTLQQLRRDGLAELRHGWAVLPDLPALRVAAGSRRFD